jgi:hypothetical protein
VRAALANAHLEEADLRGSRMLWVSLAGAHLEGADLRGSGPLWFVNLAGAHLERADFSGVDLTQVFLTGAHLEGAKTTASTSWPDGFDWQAAGVILVDEEGRPAPASSPSGAADEAAPTAPQLHGQPATGGDLDAGSEARPDA